MKPTERETLRTINLHPGATRRELGKLLYYYTTELVSQCLAGLRKAELVHRHGDRCYTTRRGNAAIEHERAVLALIGDSPGIACSDLRRAMVAQGLTCGSIAELLDALDDNLMVDLVGSGRAMRITLSANGQEYLEAMTP